MPIGGLEPPRPKPPVPKTGASTNSARWALLNSKHRRRMNLRRMNTMLATLTGEVCLLVGLATLILPLVITELSRPRDSLWGALVLALGLVLITSSDRLRGAPMLGVVCTDLLIGRLAVEVGQGRWQQLSSKERQRLRSRERWITVVVQLRVALSALARATVVASAAVQSMIHNSSSGKLWVRPEQEATKSDITEAVSTESSKD